MKLDEGWRSRRLWRSGPIKDTPPIGRMDWRHCSLIFYGSEILTCKAVLVVVGYDYSYIQNITQTQIKWVIIDFLRYKTGLRQYHCYKTNAIVFIAPSLLSRLPTHISAHFDPFPDQYPASRLHTTLARYLVCSTTDLFLLAVWVSAIFRW